MLVRSAFRDARPRIEMALPSEAQARRPSFGVNLQIDRFRLRSRSDVGRSRSRTGDRPTIVAA